MDKEATKPALLKRISRSGVVLALILGAFSSPAFAANPAYFSAAVPADFMADASTSGKAIGARVRVTPSFGNFQAIIVTPNTLGYSATGLVCSIRLTGFLTKVGTTPAQLSTGNIVCPPGYGSILGIGGDFGIIQ